MITPPKFTSDLPVELIDAMGDEGSIVRAARVSTLGSSASAEESEGLLGYLYRSGHGSPFEHAVMTFRVEAPIFVTREFLRHRISSFNEESGRYRVLEGKFYVPDTTRALVQIGKVGAYEFVAGTYEDFDDVTWAIRHISTEAWESYSELIDHGIAREVARMVLPVNTYSTLYYTANLRSILNFLSLRVDWGEEAVKRSKPQHEIEVLARQVAKHVEERFPTVFASFRDAGYVSV